MFPTELGWSHWPAPAKLNLFLHVLGRRDDGYHLLQTVFQLLDLADRIALRVRDDEVIERVAGLPSVEPQQDLALRAAHALRNFCGLRQGVDIAVLKAIPVGGGLGGGSSDAATVLLALNHLWSCGLQIQQLADLGLALGADVPLFVHGRSAWAEGVGEQLTPVTLGPRCYVIIDPRIEVATGPVFAAPELTRDGPATTIRGFFAGEPTRNDLEPIVCARHPQVAAARDWLAKFAPARLTGSGACVFAEVPDRSAGERLMGECPAQWTALVADGHDRSSLHEMLDGS